MFSTCNTLMQNQAVLPLSYIVAQYSSFRNHRQKVKNVQKEVTGVTTSKDSQKTVLCAESLIETIEKVADCDCQKIHQLFTPQVARHLALFGPELYMSQLASVSARQNNSKLFSIFRETKRAWHESHVSRDTFLENKQSGGSLPLMFKEAQMKPLFRLTQNLLSSQQSLSSNYTSLRGFKTKQSIERDAQGNFLNRLREESKSRLHSIYSRNVQQEANNNPRLKTILAEESSEEVQKHIKVAFAEGYLAGDSRKNQPRFKWIRHLQNIIFVVAMIILLVTGAVRSLRFSVVNGNEVKPEEITVSFEDVKGVEEAKQELQEIVEFLRDPEKFTSLGAELPKGALLVGPPGTGKTLLARAVAGEAGVPFFHAAGPEFDEILVGQGARRVRDLFKAAKNRSPCVVFIDEIDSVGAKRSSSVIHPYANQTINQLLAEMDGFHKNEGVIVLGATNRRDDLDKALLRPGRFDVEVQVPIPDLSAREEIFEYYLGKVKVGEDVDRKVLSRGTTGFTGADIKNVTNQAALKAAADQVETVSMKHLEAARDKVLMGPERKSRIPDEEANLVTAYHEGGHALVSFYTKDSHPLHKVTIIPRGPALGHTAYIPAKEHYHFNRSQMLASLDSLMGGRAAEELIFGEEFITSGASNDLKQATKLATHMVKDYGMSESVGLRTFEDNSKQLLGPGDSLGHSTKEAIDMEIRKILQDSYERAKAILKTRSKEHKALAEALLKYETLDADDITAILNGRPLPK